MSSARGRAHLKLLDRYVGVPLVALLGLRRKRQFPERVRRIGLMKTAAIGDTALLAGLVDDVKESYADARLTLITGADNAGVAPLLGCAVDDVIRVSPSQVSASIHALRRSAFDVLVDFGAWPRFDAFLTSMARARFTAGFQTAGQYRHYSYDRTVAHSSSEHERRNYMRLLAAIGVAARTGPEIEPPKQLSGDRLPHGEFAVFHPWSSGYRHEVKEWPIERWVALGRAIVGRIQTIVVTGGASDATRAAEVTARLQDAGVTATNVAGKLSLSELTDLLSASTVVVSVNTGVAHLAGLVGARTISLEGPTPPVRWAPLGPRVRTVVTTLAGSGYLNLGFEYRGQRLDCMEGITVDAVVDAMSDLMSREYSETSVMASREYSRRSDQGD